MQWHGTCEGIPVSITPVPVAVAQDARHRPAIIPQLADRWVDTKNLPLPPSVLVSMERTSIVTGGS